MHASERNLQIDMLKAISILFVLLWHLQPIPGDMTGSGFASASFAIGATIFYRHITLLAVPTFIAVSVYLFMLKSPMTLISLGRRLMHLGNIFIFWVLIQYGFCFLVTGSMPSLSMDTIKVGGPDLPYVGGSVFYFLFVLFKMTALAFLFIKLPEKIKIAVSVLLVIASLLYFAIAPLHGISVATVSMKNFYVYIPVAHGLIRYKESLVRLRPVILVAFIVSIAVEELFCRDLFPPYARPSILFGVVYFISMIHAFEFKPSVIIGWLSKQSLGIFALHKYWQYLFMVLLGTMKGSGSGFITPAVDKIILFFLVSVVTFASVLLLSKTKLRVYVG